MRNAFGRGLVVPYNGRMNDEDYMRLAIAEARRAESLGEVPIGAVVVYEPIDRGTRRPLAEPRVISRACNLRETTKNPAGHAEFLAMQEAARVLDAWRLSDCTVYVTLEPCPMCAGAIVNARIPRVYYGARDEAMGACGGVLNLFMERFPFCPALVGGILKDECRAVLADFFRTLRS